MENVKCPCCGGSVTIMDKEWFESLVKKNGKACFTIECDDRTNCGISMYCHYDSTDYEIMKAVAIDRFSRRVSCE